MFVITHQMPHMFSSYNVVEVSVELKCVNEHLLILGWSGFSEAFVC